MDEDAANRDAPASSLAGLGVYVKTFVALVLLATASFFLARVRLGGPAVALLIAATKAVLVLWFFMHLRAEHASSRIAVLVAAALIFLLVGLTSLDVTSRHTFPAEGVPPASSGFYQR
jgi:cytochrome c oxidase subunit 4